MFWENGQFSNGLRFLFQHRKKTFARVMVYYGSFSVPIAPMVVAPCAKPSIESFPYAYFVLPR